ncbi:MAG: nucleotide exchange factor GrpE [Kiritimatiellia bacterium]
MKEQLLRLAADFDNYKKRVQSQGNQFVREWKANFILRMLPVLDHFELGLNAASANETDDQIVAGFRRIYDQLVAVLAKEGLVRIEVTPRMQFDPSVHECVSHVPSNEYPVNTVIAETRAGYRLDQKLLRSAQVVVSSGPHTSLLQNEKQTTVDGVGMGTAEPGFSRCCQSAEQRPPPEVRMADSRDE